MSATIMRFGTVTERSNLSDIRPSQMVADSSMFSPRQILMVAHASARFSAQQFQKTRDIVTIITATKLSSMPHDDCIVLLWDRD